MTTLKRVTYRVEAMGEGQEEAVEEAKALAILAALGRLDTAARRRVTPQGYRGVIVEECLEKGLHAGGPPS